MQQLTWRVEHFSEIGSTNSWLLARALEGEGEGLVAFADFQSAGRGRLGREWRAAPGSALLCSVLLRPTLDVDQLQLAVAAVALAARAALVRLSGLRPQLKWPNDLVVGDAKLAGLLAEVAPGPRPGVVVGLGLNLSDAPRDLASTDVLAEAGVRLVPRGLLDIVLEELEWRRFQLDDLDGRAALREEYVGALTTIGQRVRVERADGVLEGDAIGVDGAGHLLLDHDGVRSVIASGDVVRLRPTGSS